MYDIDYKVKRQKKTLPTNELFDRFANFDRVHGFCRECPRYNTNFSCSPVDIDIKEYVLDYDYADIIVTQLFFKKEDYERPYTEDEFKQILRNTFYKERNITIDKIKEREENIEHANRVTGSCNICCENCREVYDECQHPDLIRYSVSSLGFDSTKILKDLFDIDLILIDKGLPKYLNNVSFLLYS